MKKSNLSWNCLPEERQVRAATLTRVPGKVSHVYRGAVYHYEANNNNEKTSCLITGNH